MDQVTKTLGAVAQSYMSNPNKLMEAQQKLWGIYGMIWQNAWSRALGAAAEPIATPARNDKRFKDKDWQRQYGIRLLQADLPCFLRMVLEDGSRGRRCR